MFGSGSEGTATGLRRRHPSARQDLGHADMDHQNDNNNTAYMEAMPQQQQQQQQEDASPFIVDDSNLMNETTTTAPEAAAMPPPPRRSIIWRLYWQCTAIGALLAIGIAGNPEPYQTVWRRAHTQARNRLALPQHLLPQLRLEQIAARKHMWQTEALAEIRKWQTEHAPEESSADHQQHPLAVWWRWIPGLRSPPASTPTNPTEATALEILEHEQEYYHGWNLSNVLIRTERSIRTQAYLWADWQNLVVSMVDPILLWDKKSSRGNSDGSNATTKSPPRRWTDLIDKVLRSRLRLLWIINVFLAVTYAFHEVVADYFLGRPTETVGATHARAPQRHRLPRDQRLGGFLGAKFLLVSTILQPDVLDFIILLWWFTCLTVLRSWSTLCAGATQQAAHAGVHPPREGAWQLLVAVLISNCCLMAVNVGLFHPVGWSMVIMLTTDCILLEIDVLCHLMAHAGHVLEQRHEQSSIRGDYDNDDDDDVPEETMDAVHNRRLSTISSTAFGLQLVGHVIAVLHYVHVWMVHGLKFRLVDGVLMLHFHSAITALVQKVTERQRSYKLAQDLDYHLPDATEADLDRAAVNGDSCCICLGSFGTGQKVKKVSCGHLYHVACLQPVLQRARSLQAAQCPLCRAKLIGGGDAGGDDSNSSSPTSASRGPVEAEAPEADGGNDGVPAAPPVPADALFRFSTEDFIPTWLPIPGFSFEVVRRPVTEPAAAAAAPVQDRAVPENNHDGEQQQEDNADSEDGQDGDGNDNEGAPAAPAAAPPNPSPFRRILVLLGVIPMSPAEEEAAMDQLVDMFPQYNRTDLLRELRQRGSAEAVAELALHGGIVPASPS